MRLIPDLVDCFLKHVNKLAQLIEILVQVFLFLLNGVALLPQLFYYPVEPVELVELDLRLVGLQVSSVHFKVDLLAQTIDLLVKLLDLIGVSWLGCNWLLNHFCSVGALRA